MEAALIPISLRASETIVVTGGEPYIHFVHARRDKNWKGTFCEYFLTTKNERLKSNVDLYVLL